MKLQVVCSACKGSVASICQFLVGFFLTIKYFYPLSFTEHKEDLNTA